MGAVRIARTSSRAVLTAQGQFGQRGRRRRPECSGVSRHRGRPRLCRVSRRRRRDSSTLVPPKGLLIRNEREPPWLALILRRRRQARRMARAPCPRLEHSPAVARGSREDGPSILSGAQPLTRGHAAGARLVHGCVPTWPAHPPLTPTWSPAAVARWQRRCFAAWDQGARRRRRWRTTFGP